MRDLVRKNLALKLISLVLAYLTWTMVVGRPPIVRTFELPIVFRAGAETLIVNYEPRTISVQLEGDEAIVRPDLDKTVYIELDVGYLVAGEQQVAITQYEVRGVPSGVTINLIDNQISVELEERQTALVKVAVQISGRPADGFTVESVRADPTVVKAIGAKTKVSKLDTVSTELVDLAAKRRSFERVLKLLPAGVNVTLEPASVRVFVDIAEQPETRELRVRVGGLPEGWTSEPSRVTATIAAPPSLFPQIDRLVRAIVAGSGTSRAGGTVSVALDFPGLEDASLARIEVLEVRPESVTVRPPPRSR